MSKLYNTNDDISINFFNFLSNTCPFLPKTALNIMPDILSAMSLSTSCITKNIVSSCKGSKFDSVQTDSVDKRVRRFFNNSNYNPYPIYEAIIKHTIDNYTCKHKDDRIHIAFDHMFKKEDFVVFMISLRLGKKSVPLWFRCFEGGHSSTEAFQEDMIKEGLRYVFDLFESRGYKVICLADRWFGSTSLLDFINEAGHTYVIRVRNNHKVLYYNKKEEHNIWANAGDLFHYTHKPTYYENIAFTRKQYKTNIVISATKSVSISKKTVCGYVEPWILVTNGGPRRAVKDYGYRFGAIEFLFKDQKSNGFNLEKSNVKNLQAFTMMYTCMCICILFLTCYGTYYTRHKNKLFKDVKIRYYSLVNGKRKRKMSIFQVGLTLFKRAVNSTVRIKISFNFILTDV